MSHSITPAVDTRTPVQIPQVSFADLTDLSKIVKIYSIHPEALSLLHPSHSPKKSAHIRKARTNHQTEFLLVELPRTNDDLKRAATILHRISGQPAPSDEKLWSKGGLSDKHYMLVHEPPVIESLKKMCKSAFIATDNSRSVGNTPQ